MKEFLNKNGYSQYKSYKQQCILFQKIVESEAVCETNDNLAISIEYYYDSQRVSVGIRAEKHGTWWSLEAYSLNENELKERLTEIETRLINIFNIL